MATYGRSKEIEYFLNVLHNQSYKNFELLIIDQNEDDRVVKIFEEYKDRIDLKYFHNQIKGLSINRNIGLSHISGDIVAFPDDDCIYETDTLEKAALFFENNKDYTFYTCNTMDKNSKGAILKTKSSDTDISIFNFMNIGISFTVFVRSTAIRSFKFDERLGLGSPFGSGEESDLLLFLLKQKSSGHYHANDYIYHPVKTETPEKAFLYGKGFGAVYKKAIIHYYFIILLPVFFLRLLKGIFNIIIYKNKDVRSASFRGRLTGFIRYSNEKLKRILINGDFFCRRLNGIERYAYEITIRLDKISKPGEIAIIVPKNTENVLAFSNLKIIRHKKNIKSHLWWQMITLQWFLITHRQYTVLEFGNNALPFAPGIVFLHDIYCEFFPEDFTGKRDKLIRVYSRWQYRLISKKAKKIITVSYFTKNQIIENFRVDPEKISVIYSSWEHFKLIKADYSVFDIYPALKKDGYYFSLGSLSKRKNIKWIIEYARKNPDAIFAISGVSLPTVKVDELNNSTPQNIILLGYLDDSKVKALMENCKAFILPSYYEGFGLTPLEALACGAQVIVAKAASLPEIYGNTAHYIDPYNTDVDLDKLLREPVEKPDVILAKYSYDTAAEQVYELIK
jgi:glycosyltransferase involved in cell wall biosynthesis